MKLKKAFRISVGGIAVLVMTFAFLPALLVNPDIEVMQNVINYLNKD